MLELNQIYCGDHLKVMQDIDAESIDLVVTSPPYDNLRTYKGYSFDFERLAKDLFRVIKKGGVVVWVVGDQTINGSETGTSFRQALYFKDIGFNLHDTMIWEKSSYVPLTHNRYEQCFEYMFILSKGKPKSFIPIMMDCIFADRKSTGTFRHDSNNLSKRHKNAVNKKKICKNVIIFPVTKKADGHPAAFPKELADWHIISWSNENDIVLDPMCGSGTTCKMAKVNNRNFIGIDISPEYYDIARQRLEQADYWWTKK